MEQQASEGSVAFGAEEMIFPVESDADPALEVGSAAVVAAMALKVASQVVS